MAPIRAGGWRVATSRGPSRLASALAMVPILRFRLASECSGGGAQRTVLGGGGSAAIAIQRTILNLMKG